MRTKRQTLWIVLLMALMSTVLGCSPQEPEKRITSQKATETPSSRTQQVQAIFGKLTGRGSHSELRTASSEQLENSEVYITNFSSGGFLLYGVGADDNIEVYGVSSKGCLASSDTVENYPLNQALEGAIALQSRTDGLEDSFKRDDPTGGVIPPPPYPPIKPLPFPINPTDKYPVRKTIIEQGETVHPYIPSTLPFSQRDPFNRYVHKPYLGCANSALAGFLSHYRIPRVVIGKKQTTVIEWDQLWEKHLLSDPTAWSVNVLEDTSLSHQVATICSYIFYSNPRVWLIPNKSGTGVFPKRVRQFLEKICFRTEYKAFSQSDLLDYLTKYKRPVLMYGEASFTSRHYWIIDGYLEFCNDRVHYVKYEKNADWKEESREKNVSSKILVHCNWGWAGTDNGYFDPNVFNPDNGDHSDFEIWETHSDKKKDGDFRRNAKAFYTYPRATPLITVWDERNL